MVKVYFTNLRIRTVPLLRREILEFTVKSFHFDDENLETPLSLEQKLCRFRNQRNMYRNFVVFPSHNKPYLPFSP